MQKSTILALACGIVVAMFSLSAKPATAMTLPAPAGLAAVGDTGLIQKVWESGGYYYRPRYRRHYRHNDYYYSRPYRSYRRHYYSRPYYDYGYRNYGYRDYGYRDYGYRGYYSPRRYYRSRSYYSW